MENFWNKAVELLTQAGGKIIIAILIFIVGRLIIKHVLKLCRREKFMSKLDPTVKSFLVSFIRIGLYVILVISIIGVLGVPMASIITVLASCGVAIGMALQGALSNLAGGIMMLIFRPFNVGDYINAASAEGTVRAITLFYTEVITVDNKKVTIPNGALMGANVTNYSSEEKRRVDLTFNIGAEHDIQKVQSIMQEVIGKTANIEKEPDVPFAAPTAGVPGGLQYTVKVWTAGAKYWDVYNDLIIGISTALGEAGIAGPLTHIQMEGKN